MPVFLNPRSFHHTILIASLATTLSVAFGAVPNPPPSQWKGINYSPRYHSYFRMLYDWNTYDSTLGGYVRDIADSDMALLSQNGYNLLHLYLWDHRLLDDAVFNRWCLDAGGNPIPGCTPPYSEPSGFANYPGNPALFSSQFTALQDFVARAENHGLFVALHFASGTLIHDVQNSSRACSAIANDFGTWANTFVTGLTPARHNVLVWGVAYSFGADSTDQVNPPSRYNDCFGRVYQAVDSSSRQNAPPGLTGLGLIGVNPQFDFITPRNDAQIVRPSTGYAWDVATAQKVAKTMTDELTTLYQYPKSPDVYMFGFYNANAADLRNNLWTLINSNGGDSSRMVIPANLIFPVEFATSSSGTGADSWGDAETPTTTANGHNAWLANTLCTFQALNISKYAYWAMYDPTTLWIYSPWYYYGQELWWNGYWGLGWEYPPSGFKPAWNTLASFNQSPGSLYCPATPAPNFNAWTLSDYLTVGQAPKIVWTASEMTSLTLDGSSGGGSWACDNLNYYPGAMYFDYALGGSCAFTFGGWNTSPGYRTYSVVANNNGVTTPYYLTVNYGYAPWLIYVMGQNYYGQAVSVGLNQVFYINGKGFALSRVNYLRWTRPGYADVYMYQRDVSGHYFYQDTFNILTIVDPRIARGTWTVYAYNGQSVWPAVISSVTVY